MLLTTPLLYLVGQHESVRKDGREVTLAIAPIDPRSLFQGDYVILRYKISTVPVANASDFADGETVYVMLQDDGGIWSFASLRRNLPPQDMQPYLRATVKYRGTGNSLQLSYGIEQYFVPEGRGGEVENLARQGNDRLTVRVRIGEDGQGQVTALLQDGAPLF
jgi:uncharacterized membrane-anchored protein